MSVDLNGIITWLKGWFYDKTEVTGFLNNKANVSDLQTTNSNLSALQSTVDNKVDKVTGKGLSTEDYTSAEKSKLANIEAEANKTVVDSALSSTSTNPLQNKVINTELAKKANKTHTHKTDEVYEDNVLNNIGTSLGDSQTTINLAIDTAIGNLSSIKAIEVVSTLPTASSSTMGRLYIISENSKINVYYTITDGNNFEWHKMDSDILDDLSIDWSDIDNNPFSNKQPSDFANATHNHTKSQITDFSHTHNTNELTDPNAHTSIGTYVNSTQTTINTKIEEAIDNIETVELAKRKVFYVDYTDLPQGTSDWGYKEMYIVNYGNEWRLYYWKEVSSPYFHFDFKYITLSQKGDSITSIELVPKSDDSTGAIRLYYGDEQ